MAVRARRMLDRYRGAGDGIADVDRQQRRSVGMGASVLDLIVAVGLAVLGQFPAPVEPRKPSEIFERQISSAVHACLLLGWSWVLGGARMGKATGEAGSGHRFRGFPGERRAACAWRAGSACGRRPPTGQA